MADTTFPITNGDATAASVRELLKGVPLAYDYVESGCVVSAGAGLNVSITAGVLYANGVKVSVDARTNVGAPPANTATVYVYYEVDVATVNTVNLVTNTTGVAPSANAILLATVATNGTNVTGATDKRVRIARLYHDGTDARLDAETGELKISATVVRPVTDAATDLGKPTDQWRDLLISRNIVIAGTQVLDASRNATLAATTVTTITASGAAEFESTLTTKNNQGVAGRTSGGAAKSLAYVSTDDKVSIGDSTVPLRLYGSDILFQANNVWHSGNDGAGSGLDADTVDGLNASISATASTVAARDSSGFLLAAQFELPGTGRITRAGSSAATWTFPNATGTLALVDLTQTWTAEQTFSVGVVLNNNIQVRAKNTGGTLFNLIRLDASNNVDIGEAGIAAAIKGSALTVTPATTFESTVQIPNATALRAANAAGSGTVGIARVTSGNILQIGDGGSTNPASIKLNADTINTFSGHTLARLEAAQAWTAAQTFTENPKVDKANPVLILKDADGTTSDMGAYVRLEDSAGEERGWMGFGTSNNEMRVQNNLGAIRFDAVGGVNVNGSTVWDAGNFDPTTKSDTTHNHDAAYSALGHTHDDRYFTETESDARFLGISAKAADSNLLDGIDSTGFALAAHNHDGTYAAASHTHASGDLPADVAYLSGGTFTGAPVTANAIAFSGKRTNAVVVPLVVVTASDIVNFGDVSINARVLANKLALSTAATSPLASDLHASSVSMKLNEGSNTLEFYVKYADGTTTKKGSIALSAWP